MNGATMIGIIVYMNALLAYNETRTMMAAIGNEGIDVILCDL